MDFICIECSRSFSDLEGELHPVEEGIICPFCYTTNHFPDAPPIGYDWLAIQEAHFDRQWEYGDEA